MYSSHCLVALGMMVRLSVADVFLQRLEMGLNSPQQRGLLQEIEGIFGQGSASKRLRQLEAVFTPMHAALPKDEQGFLGPSAVRYALHRYFLQRHGWVVPGLEANGGLWNESSAIEIIKGRVPSYIENLFEDRLGQHGFGVHELAVFAAVFENLVRIETTRRIEAVYSSLGLSIYDALAEDDFQEVLDTSLMLFMFDPNLEDANKIAQLRDRAHIAYPGWNDTLLFLHDTRKSVAHAELSQANPFRAPKYDLPHVLHVTEAIADQYGPFQDFECQELTQTLLALEHKGTGRVRLGDFYGLALAGDWRFSESLDYLRTLGALDESDPEDPRVIVTNYMYGKNQCLAASKYYAVCCIDHCETLLGAIEGRFTAPEVLPSEIAAAVSRLPSATVAAPRNLSTALLERLNMIAASHGGKVPLHSRSFSQFMHHAYPRECPFPHVSGTIKPMTPREWVATSGQTTKATNEELKLYGKFPVTESEEGEPSDDSLDGYVAATDEVDEPAAWTYEEELVVIRHKNPRAAPTQSGLRLIFMVMAASVVVLGLWQSAVTGKNDFARAINGNDAKVFV